MDPNKEDRKEKAMKNKMHVKLFTYLLIVFFTSLATAYGDNPGGMNPGTTPYFRAALTGGNETPPVNTKAKGTATLETSASGDQMLYKLTDKDISDVTAAHIHMGKKGQEGPPIVNLYKGPEKKGPFSGTLAQGTITDTDLVGPLKGKQIPDLAKLIESGDAYVNVHTRNHPNGEIRGELRYKPVGE